MNWEYAVDNRRRDAQIGRLYKKYARNKKNKPKKPKNSPKFDKHKKTYKFVMTIPWRAAPRRRRDAQFERLYQKTTQQHEKRMGKTKKSREN